MEEQYQRQQWQSALLMTPLLLYQYRKAAIVRLSPLSGGEITQNENQAYGRT
ncbi:hypothetical protein XNC1_4433 [Xenorhabdus nematophila ATCC 19061]|uniref:Uncharacterized protein n=1 Tax=Xenorhabdus nematophila (strain ATCC 19061 / DSM 3370 / CCUG 14189 / LMG 1036 / NCIMB 9965 / AN6) TaxID=406817 RepID=D3VEZ8_XENNA|nr:hypothetical protein XNC1_4433 [Xenorhabdus nematophila ATCC 19061]